MKTRYIITSILCIAIFASTAFAGKYQPVSVYAKKGKNYSEYEVAAATIAALFGRPANIMSVKSDDGDIFYVKYMRTDDNTFWVNKCKFDGSRVIWGSSEGRWRTHQADDYITYEVKNGELHINTNTGISKKYSKSSFKK